MRENATKPTVLVTGADGFIGSHLVEALVARDYPVRALVQYNSFNSWGWLDHNPVAERIDVVAGDIRDPHQCQSLVDGIDWVFNLAALIAIPFSYQAPASYVATNVQGTVNLCQAAKAAGVRRFVQTSTSEVYGTARQVPIAEDHPLQPQSPYSASKIASDAMALSFHHSFELPVVVARPFNTFGPRQSARAVIPTVISQIASGRNQLQLGNLDATRDFNYVADTCAGLIALAEAEAVVGEAVNIGSGREISIGDLVRLIAGLMNTEVSVQQDPQRLRPAGSEVERLLCDSRRFLAATGLRPQYSLEQGLEATIAWFQQPANLVRYKPDAYNV